MMAEASNRVTQAFEELNGTRSSLQNYAQEAQATWTGAAARTFGGVMTSFDERLNKIGEALSTLNENLGAARLEYERTEEENAQSTSSIEGLLSEI
jgi:WXG100 family type VII secretion target